MTWFVDGMNVIGTRPDGWWRDRDGAMLRLVDLLERWAAAEGEDVTVVFERPPRPPIRSTVIEVAHAPRPGRDAADHEIVRRLRAQPRPARCGWPPRIGARRAGLGGRRRGRRRRGVPAAGRRAELHGAEPRPRLETISAMAEEPPAAPPPRRARPEPRPPAPPGLEGDARPGRPRRPATAPAAAAPAAAALGDRAARDRAAGAQRVDLLAGAQARLPRADPLQPDVPQPGEGRQRAGDLLHRRLDPGHVQGRHPVRPERQPTTDFSTQVPSFANNSELSGLLQQQGVTIDAKSPDKGPSFLQSLLFGFGPTLLLILLFVLIMRRAAGGRRRRRRADVASGARGPAGSRAPTSRSPSRTSPGSTRPRRSSTRSSTSSRTRTSTCGSAAGSRAACC